MIFPLQSPGQLRNHDELKENGVTRENGLLGSTPLNKILTIPNGLPIDTMHLLFLGICKMLVIRLFSKQFRSQNFFIGKR